MKGLFLLKILVVSLITASAQANEQPLPVDPVIIKLIPDACEKAIIRASIEKKSTSLWLDYGVEELLIDGDYGLAEVTGWFSDADADYSYGEYYLVEFQLKDGSCEVQSARLTQIWDDGFIEEF